MEIQTNSTSDLPSLSENSTLGMNLSGIVLNEVTSVRDKEQHFRVPGPFDRYIEQIPLIGYPGPIFWIIHASALVSLTTSFLVSIALISYVCLSHRGKDREQVTTQTTVTDGVTPPETITKSNALPKSKIRNDSFFKWNIGERLVIYLAVTDLTYEISHIIDHKYVIYNQRNPPDLACSVFGFILNEFGIAQWVVVLYSALRACSLIVFNKKLHTGRWDWILIFSALGAPGSLGILSASLGFLGGNGVW